MDGTFVTNEACGRSRADKEVMDWCYEEATGKCSVGFLLLGTLSDDVPEQTG